MIEIDNLKKLIESKKEPDKQFFLDLLDGDKQSEYENERIEAVMTLLKVLYISKLKTKLKEARSERERLIKATEHRAESYRRILELNEETSKLKAKIQTYKPLFDEPYFARMDAEDSREGYNSYYIGKHGNEGLEIIDWRAPLARKYYQKSRTSFSINDYDYKLILRRALRTKSGKVLDFKNEFLSLKDYLTEDEIGGRDESLIFDPFLKEILSSRKEKREICDIIETIQEKQYEIITLPERAEFVTQGVAGSGKTMIMLHRLSYILYNNEALRPSDVLMITPSDSFNAFIDELATILELEKVRTSTLDSYFIKLLKNAGVDIAEKIDYKQEIPVELLKYIYSDSFLKDVRKRLSKIYDGVSGMFLSPECAEMIDGILKNVREQESEYTFIKNASLRVRRCVLGEIKEKADGGLFYTKQFRNLFNWVSDIREFLELLKDKRMSDYAFFYKQLLSFYKSLRHAVRYFERICDSAADDLAALKIAVEKEISDLRRYKTNTGNGSEFTYAEGIEKRENLIREIEKTTERILKIKDGFLPLYDFAAVLKGDKNFTAIGKCETAYDVARIFYRETVKKAKQKFGMSTKKLCRFDPFALCTLLSEIGFTLYPKYAFVFVDEAQDISLAEYGILKRVNERAAFNIFGDLKQNVTPYRGIADWSQLGYTEYNLNLNYRNTNEIVEYVSGKLGIDMRAIGFSGSGVQEIDERSVGRFLNDKNGLRAVITAENNLQKYVRKSYNVLGDTGKISKSKINVMTVYESKGLEFTAVAVDDAGMSDNEKYIAYTRALKYLAVIKNTQSEIYDGN